MNTNSAPKRKGRAIAANAAKTRSVAKAELHEGNSPKRQQPRRTRPSKVKALPTSKHRSNLKVDQLTPADLPIWRESLLGIDWVRLRSSSVYYGFGVPRGDGSAVVLVPGFLATDLYLLELFTWLYRMKYKPYFSRIGRNADCPAILMRHLLTTVNRAFQKTGRKVHLIGHSFGGVIARSLAASHPDKIASVITMGSPLRGVRVHPFVLYMSGLVHQKIHLNKVARPKELQPHSNDCFTAACSCGFACTWRSGFPTSVDQTAIYTKSDGIVDWQMCRTEDKRVDIEVRGTHCGLAWNPDVFRIIAQRLHKVSRKRPRGSQGHSLTAKSTNCKVS